VSSRIVLLWVAAAAVLAALFFVRPLPTPGPPMRDFEAYYAAGEISRQGGDPYSSTIWIAERHLQGVVSQRHELLPFVGPPATVPLWRAFSRLSFPAANTVWRIVLLLAIALLALATLRLCGRQIQPFTVLVILVLAVGFGPLTSAFALGQIALPAYACAVGALLWRPWALLAWVQPNVAIALLCLAHKRSGALVFIASAGIFAFLCLALAGGIGAVHYLRVLHEHTQAERFSAIQLTPAAIAYGLGTAPTKALALGSVVAAIAIIIWVYVMRSSGNDVSRFCGTCALLALVMPFFHEHDLLVTFLPAVYFTSRCSKRIWPAVTAGALLCATDWLGLAQRPDGALQTVLLVGAAGVAMFLLRDDLPLTSLATPALVLVAIALVAAAAQSSPLPVWPDAMRHAPAWPNGGAAAMWHAEQVASGLLVPNITWALLRCLSLAGCIVLACAALISSKYLERSRSPLPVPA
jgi:glycosyl transferase family 87